MNAKDLDQWFTKPSVARQCVDVLKRLGINGNFIEPSAGEGVFLDLIPSAVGFDIDPKRDDIIKQDWLQNKLEYHSDNIVFGNPPYGRKGKLAVQFINKASECADTIAFIVPLVLAKSYSAQRHVNSELKLRSEITLPKNSFTFESKEVDVPSCFQVWTRHPCRDKRLRKPETEHPDLEIKIYNKTLGAEKWLKWNWDIAVKRNTKNGEWTTDRSMVTIDYHWVLIKGPIKILKRIKWDKLNDNKMTAGIGKADVVNAYKEALK